MPKLDLWTVAAIVLFLNIPFGYWRSHVRSRSRQWFLAIHLPVPAVITLRLVSGLGFRLITFPVLVGSFSVGQLVGGGIHWFRERRDREPLTACLVMDLVRGRRR